MEKKGKDAIAKAANSKKKGVKKWTKGKVKEKVNNAVFLDKAGYDKIMGDIPRMGKLISVATVIEKFKVGGSVARAILRQLIQSGALRRIDAHSKQFICASTVAPKKTEEVVKGGQKADKGAKGGQKGEKGGKKAEKADKADKAEETKQEATA